MSRSLAASQHMAASQHTSAARATLAVYLLAIFAAALSVSPARDTDEADSETLAKLEPRQR